MTIRERPWYRAIIKTSNVCNAIINFICVVLLTAQVVAILIMVFGRYLFNSVPNWTEQFALFCMIWFAMFSIALGVRNDSHIKVDVVDSLVSPKGLMYFKLFGNICVIVFGGVMVHYGMFMTELTWSTLLSAFRIPSGLQYFSAVAGGIFMVVNAIVCCIELIAVFRDGERAKERGM